MQASTLLSLARASRIRRIPSGDRVLLALLGAAGAVAVAVESGAGGRLRSATLLSCSLVAGLVLAPRALRHGADLSVRAAAAGLFASACLAAGTWSGASGERTDLGLRGPAPVVAALLATSVVVTLARLRAKTRHSDRSPRLAFEMIADAAAAVVVLGGVLSLAVWSHASSGADHVIAITLVTGSILALAVAAVLAASWPSALDIGMLASAAGLGWAATWLVRGAVAGPPPEIISGMAALALAGAILLERAPPNLTPRWAAGHGAGDPGAAAGFAWVWLPAACLLLIPAIAVTPGSPLARATVVSLVTAALAARVVAAQVTARRALVETSSALDERERAISSLAPAAASIAASEARLRLLFDSAVDGVVEIDDRQTIIRANDAFCSMVGLGVGQVVGRPWEEVARTGAGGGDSLATLPDTGEAVLSSEGGTRYLEARSSALATSPPGSLLVIRDVTPSRVAEQTIRTLFQFLQDRDEDRSRLLHRTNSAIEAERNRIARDLHDGPIQGVTGATLSLEAVRLMMSSGSTADALDMLTKIQMELGEEADSLRRVMSDLRPPVLEERGLVPAVRELCQRFEQERGISVWITAGPYVQVPAEVETLAYRVVQEALSNVAKHAKATQASVTVETGLGSLKVEITDDGCGFDPLEARNFLRVGKVGLASMRERSELGGGTLTVRSHPGAGTTVSAMLPFDILAVSPRG
jgi:PAS domain S-box-containing protein